MKKCTVNGCNDKHYGKGYCSKHYQRVYKNGTSDKKIIKKKICNIEGCEKPRHSKEYCGQHYALYQRTGSFITTKGTKICKVSGCGKPHSGLGYCRYHYVKAKTYGHPLCGHKLIINKKDELLRAAARRKARKYFKGIKLFCVIGGCHNKNIGLHHEDYNEPLNIIPLCQKHHVLRHAEMRRENFYNDLALAEA